MQHQYSYPEDRYILIGTVVKPQGLHGEVSIHAFSGQPENLNNYKSLYLVDKAGEISPRLKIESLRIQKGKAIVLFDRVGDRSFAEKLVGMGVLLNRDDLPALADDEFYWHQLSGCDVYTVDGQHLGTLTTVFSNGAQDVMVIQENDQEFLIPLTPSLIVEQNKEKLVIDPPPGLLEINSGENDTGTGHPA